MKKIHCRDCNVEIKDKDNIALIKKMYGKDQKWFYCYECLAEELCVTVEKLHDLVEQFKEQGCTLFG